MVVRCRLGDIMKERGLTNKDVVALTGISRNTITSLAANATKRIDYDTLEGLCRGLGVTPGDLIEYVCPGIDERTKNAGGEEAGNTMNDYIQTELRKT